MTERAWGLLVRAAGGQAMPEEQRACSTEGVMPGMPWPK